MWRLGPAFPEPSLNEESQVVVSSSEGFLLTHNATAQSGLHDGVSPELNDRRRSCDGGSAVDWD